MTCEICCVDTVLKAEQAKYVKFFCSEGHSWTEKYTDEGGIHQRPKVYSDVNEILFPKDKMIYKRLLSEISRNIGFFRTATPEQVVNYLVDKCNVNKKTLLILLRKIDEFNKGA